MSFFGTRLSSAVTQLRGELSAAPQTANDTITKLVEKIQTSPQVDDRRTAVLGLKGLSRDWKADVGTAAMPSLIAVLRHDAPHDVDIAKAVLETLMQLCETQEKPAKDDVGLKHIDQLLEVSYQVVTPQLTTRNLNPSMPYSGCCHRHLHSSHDSMRSSSYRSS